MDRKPGNQFKLRAVGTAFGSTEARLCPLTFAAVAVISAVTAAKFGGDGWLEFPVRPDGRVVRRQASRSGSDHEQAFGETSNHAPGLAAVITFIAAIVLGFAGVPGIALTAGVLAILTVLAGVTLRMGGSPR